MCGRVFGNIEEQTGIWFNFEFQIINRQLSGMFTLPLDYMVRR